MKSLLQNSRTLLAAFAVATAGLTAPALANDTNAATANVETVAYAQEYASLSSQEALDQSNGRVLLHVGEGYSNTVLENDIKTLENAGLTVVIARGGPNDQITPYFYGNQYPPRSYTDNDSVDMVATIIQAAKQLQLIASADATPSQDSL